MKSEENFLTLKQVEAFVGDMVDNGNYCEFDTAMGSWVPNGDTDEATGYDLELFGDAFEMAVMVDGEDVQRETFTKMGVGFNSPILCRRETYDDYVVKEIQRSYGLLGVEGETFVDVGGNIGAFSVWAMDQGATTGFVFEPEPNNFAMLALNIAETSVTAYQQALNSATSNTGCELYLSKTGKNPGNTSTRKIRGRSSISVDTRNFQSFLFNNPEVSVVKMDCEGAEYDLLPFIEDSNVRQIAMELHLQGSDDAGTLMSQAQKIPAMFAGWECLKQPVLNNDKLWHTLAVYRRT